MYPARFSSDRAVEAAKVQGFSARLLVSADRCPPAHAAVLAAAHYLAHQLGESLRPEPDLDAMRPHICADAMRPHICALSVPHFH